MPPTSDEKEYSWKFVVRVSPELHKVLAIGALRRGRSLDEHCVHLLREKPAPYGETGNIQHIVSETSKWIE